MRMHLTVIAGLAVVLATPSHAQQGTGLASVAYAMGATSLNSIEYTGSGSVFNFGQAYEPGGRWPRFVQRRYTAAINYQTQGMRLTQVRSQGEYPPRGGGAQPVGADQTTIQVVSGKSAWQEGGAQAAANPGAVADRLRQLWTTPHGVIKAALANAGRVEGNTATFSIEGREVKATFNAQNLVEKVSYLSTSEVVGDYPLEIAYSDYADFGRNQVSAPYRADRGRLSDLGHHRQRGKAQCRRAARCPGQCPASRGAAAAGSRGEACRRRVVHEHAQRARLGHRDAGSCRGGRRYHRRGALARGHGRDRQARPQQADPLRHQHACALRPRRRPSHLCGKRRDRVTHELNKPFFEKVWARPRTIAPDLLSKLPRPAIFETVGDKKVMTDGTRTIELYFMKGTSHNVANLLVYMPKEGLLYWGDGYNPPEGDDPRDLARTPEQAIDLYRVITMNNLDVKTVAPAHGAGPKPYDNLKKAIGILAP